MAKFDANMLLELRDLREVAIRTEKHPDDAVVIWVVAAVAIPRGLPSLASVTQGNNSAFLPANAASNKAATLAAPLGVSLSTTPVPVVAAVSSGSFSAADQAWQVLLLLGLGSEEAQGKDREVRLGAEGGAERRRPRHLFTDDH